jgi:ribonuclease HI
VTEKASFVTTSDTVREWDEATKAPAQIERNIQTSANLATTPDGDLVREIVQILQERVAAWVNTFLVKIKVHRDEPLNEAADSRAEQRRTAHNAEDTNEYTPQLLWDHPRGKTIFSWDKNKNSRDDHLFC